MIDWQERVKEERTELYKKCVALTNFVATFTGAEAEILREQLQIMRQYLSVLDRRIERFK